MNAGELTTTGNVATQFDRARFDRDGFQIIGQVLCLAEIENILRILGEAPTDGATIALARQGARFGRRDLFSAFEEVRELARHPALSGLAEQTLAAPCRAVRALYFDKPPAANWAVPWHQDLTIAVRERRGIKDYRPWSMKAGMPHVQPPLEILESMVAVRIHLDDCGSSNGGLRVMPGSHREGRIGEERKAQWLKSTRPIVTEAMRGDVLLMRPLVLHASSPSEAPAHRRVIHLEYASAELASGLEWHDAI